MNQLLDVLGTGLDMLRSRRFPAALAIAGIVGLFLAALFMFPSFDSYSDISELTLFGAFVGFVAAGETLVILIGGVDLSAPWVMTTGGILVAGWATAQHVPTVVAIIGALAVAGCVGAFNGIIVAWLGLSPVIVTLATNGLVEGGLLAYERGMSPLNVPTPITHWVYTKVWGLSSAGIFWIVASIILAILLRRSTPGFRHLATGGNRIAAVLSGVPTRLVTVGAYCGCSVLCALAGILYSGFVQIPYYGMGDPFLFEAVAGAVIGGLAFTGGEGSFAGTLVGVLFIVTLNQFMSALNVSAGVVDLIYGAAILFALAVSGPGTAGKALTKRPARRPAAQEAGTGP
jgi:ribose transport system permease protein